MDNNTVTIQGHGFKEVWRSYDHAEGFWVDGAETCPQTGELRPLHCHHMFRTGSVGGPLVQIMESIPKKVLSAVSSYDQYPIELTALASMNERAFFDLHSRNPLLLVLVARAVSRHVLWRPGFWAEVLGRRWHEISEAIGCHRSVGKLAAKVLDRELMSNGYVQLFLTVARKPEMARLLRHVKSITLDVLTVALTLTDQARECPALLHAAAANDSMIPYVTEDATGILQVRKRMNLQPHWPYKWVPEQRILSYWRGRMEETALREGVEVTTAYPPPPISPDSVWTCILTAEELKEFADQWSNCALSYHWRLLTGVTAIYHERTISPTALCVVVDFDTDRWRVSAVLMPDNQPPPSDVEERVRIDFEEAINRE